MRAALTGFGIIGLLALTACGQQGLRTVSKPGEGPDEFLILPANPLSPPQNYSALPTPTPGGTNLADRDPEQEVVAALGGRLPSSSGVPASDAALVTAASRYGAPGNARAELTQEYDEQVARAQRWQSLRLVDRYDSLFRREWLPAQDEADRFRRSGIAVPSAPPAE